MQRLTIYGTILAATAFIAIIVGAYNRGFNDGLAKAELQARRDMEQLAKTHRAIAAEQLRIAQESAENQERIRVVYRTIREEVIKYAEVTRPVQCLEPQGVDIINRAAKGAP